MTHDNNNARDARNARNARRSIAQAAAAYALADAREAVRRGDPIPPQVEQQTTSMTIPMIQELRPLARDDRHLLELFSQRIKELKASKGA